MAHTHPLGVHLVECDYNVLIHTSSTLHVFINVRLVFILRCLKVSTLSRLSFLLLFIILISSYCISYYYLLHV